MTTIDTKALALRVAGELTEEAKSRRDLCGVSVNLLRDIRPEELDALAAFLREAASPWRPIETAPRTEQDILLYRGSMPPIVAGWYDNGEEAGWSAYDKPDVWIIEDPTHWCPLPTPPSAGGGDA